MAEDNFKAQNRGGKGIKGMETINDDYIVELMMTRTHHNLLFFTNKGRVYRLKTYQIPEGSRTARGTNIVNLIQLQPDEKVTSMIQMKNMEDGEYLIMATKNGIVKRTKLSAYANIHKNGLMAIRLRDDDKLIEVKKTSGNDDIMLFTKFGQSIRFNENDVRSTGRDSMGVIGMSLIDEDDIIAMQNTNEGESLMIVSKKGLGKCTKISEFATQHRGGKGVKCYRILEKTGNLAGVKAVHEDDEMMIITTEGIIIRIRVNETALLGRITSGVKLINLKDDVEVASIEIVRGEKTESDEDTTEESSEKPSEE
jgi:DNA gyrase subunit A